MPPIIHICESYSPDLTMNSEYCYVCDFLANQNVFFYLLFFRLNNEVFLRSNEIEDTFFRCLMEEKYFSLFELHLRTIVHFCAGFVYYKA